MIAARPLKISRKWAMPNKNTFEIAPVAKLIHKHMHGYSVDPFANKNRIAQVTNDIDPQYDCDFNMDALDFLKTFEAKSVDTLMFDPPYSPRQVADCYTKMDRAVNKETTQSSFWGNLKKEIARIVAPGGKVISCGWNSGGIGQTLGFEILEVLLVPHGGWHNDTIITVEQKTFTLFDQKPQPQS